VNSKGGSGWVVKPGGPWFKLRLAFFQHFLHIFYPHCDCSIRVLRPHDSHLLCFCFIVGFITTKRHLYNNSLMHTAIFKLFPSVVNPVGWLTAQSFFTQIIAPYNSVPEFTFICSLIVPNFKAITLHIKKLQRFLQVCEKNNLSPLTPWRRKKSESLTTHISQMTTAN